MDYLKNKELAKFAESTPLKALDSELSSKDAGLKDLEILSAGENSDRAPFKHGYLPPGGERGFHERITTAPSQSPYIYL